MRYVDLREGITVKVPVFGVGVVMSIVTDMVLVENDDSWMMCKYQDIKKVSDTDIHGFKKRKAEDING